MEREPAARIADLLSSANRRMRRASKLELERAGVTHSQLRVLRLLSAAGEPLRVSELARRLDVIPRSATSVVDLLEAGGLVERRPDPADRRAILVALTPAGDGVLRSMRAHRAAGLAQMLDRLTDDEQAELIRLLTVLTADD
ncbi:MarR family winged helix-turn-helix transcriptional regulator [Jiangella alkaliphila]|uniref:DNA-binding transcriptional regulator, MarR family n=1 Tax=Jiangella alkaliphila TaxID=419479 RepID=A0A1H2M299_9ACTN|nr:MarR family transcriptional regulator [Jiangella alkaliphila]SDU86991.1 DNA-binding transcriptional regulator, MarR family [Jiangella alkaliphila]